MASGSFSQNVTTRSYPSEAGYTAYLYWNETSTGISGSTPYSVVSVSFKMKKIASWANAYNTGTGLAYTFKVDGTSNETGNITYNTQTWTLNTEYTLWTKSITVNHASDGSKTVALSLEVTDTVLTNFTVGGSAILTNIPLGSTLSLASNNVNLGASNVNLVASITRYSTDYYHRIRWMMDSTQVASVDVGQVASYTYTFQPSVWLTRMTTSATASCTAVLFTYSDSNYSHQVGNASSVSFTITCTATPTVTLSSAPRGTSYTTGVSTTLYFDGYSTAQLTFSGSGVQGSSITKYMVYQGSSCLSSNASSPYTTGVLNGTSAITFKVVVVDSRGKQGQATVTVTPKAYAPPAFSNISTFRCNSEGTSSSAGTYLSVKATATATGTGNSITALKVSTKTAEGTAVQSNVTLTSGTASVLGSGSTYSISTSYIVVYSATDKMGNTSTRNVTISTSSRIINIRNQGKGIAFGKFAEEDNCLDSAWMIRRVSGANIFNVFTGPALSGITDVNDMTLIGYFFAQASVVSNLPTSNAGQYYSVICEGTVQRAIRYSGNGALFEFVRYYANNQWYPWVKMSEGILVTYAPSTLSGLNSNLVAAIGDMAYPQKRTVWINQSASITPFGTTKFFVDIYKQNDSYAVLKAYQVSGSGSGCYEYRASYYDGAINTWVAVS